MKSGVLTFTGNVKWYERGSGDKEGYDKCKFFAVAISLDSDQEDLLGNKIPGDRVKVILYDTDAKKCFQQAQAAGIDLNGFNGDIYSKSIYKPEGTVPFSFSTNSPKKEDGKTGYKYEGAVDWSFL